MQAASVFPKRKLLFSDQKHMNLKRDEVTGFGHKHFHAQFLRVALNVP